MPSLVSWPAPGHEHGLVSGLPVLFLGTVTSVRAWPKTVSHSIQEAVAVADITLCVPNPGYSSLS